METNTTKSLRTREGLLEGIVAGRRPTKVGAMIAALIATAGASLPVVGADPGSDACSGEIQAALDHFRSFDGNGVPTDVAANGLHRVVDACGSGPQDPPPMPRGDIVPNLADTVDECAGGGSTITGWANYIDIGGDSFHLLNGPASSHWAITFYEDEVLTANGYTRSALDDIVSENTPATNNFQENFWWFADLPMSFSGYTTYHCLAGILTSTQIEYEGVPLGIGIGSAANAPHVGVRSTGTTCLVPC